jgi:Leucine-rich repeat (LRR) protein
MHLGRCVSLKVLFLSGNRIQWKDLQNLNKLKTLVKLDLTGNDLDQMPATDGYYSDMKELEMLVLDRNKIQRFR